jgi:uncharacterized protein YuzE
MAGPVKELSMIRQSFDFDANALYVRLTDEKVARTAEIDACTLVDLSADGRVVGIEVIAPQRYWPLDQILQSFDISPEQAYELRLYLLKPAQLSLPAHPDARLPVAVG